MNAHIVFALLALAGARPGPTPSRFQWPAGTEVRYRLEWRGRTRFGVERRVFDGGIDLAGDLVVRSFGARGEATVLGVKLDQLRRATITALGQELAADPAVLTATEALVEVGPRGNVLAIHFPRGAPPLAVPILQALVSEAQVTLPARPAPAWTALEAGSQARAEERYQVDAADPLTLHRVSGRLDGLTVADAAFLRGAAPAFSARATIRLDAGGRVASMHSESTVAARAAGPAARAIEGETSFALVATSVTRRAPSPAPVADGPTRVPGQLVSELADADLDRQFAGDLTVDSVRATVNDYDHGVDMDPAWIGRAAAFVRLHPEAVPALVEELRGGAAPAKELVFDILSGGGSGPAQAAMRAVIEGDLEPGLRASLLSRFTFVPAPERATLELLARDYRAARAVGDRLRAYATLYPLGAVVGKLAAGEVHRELVAELRQATSAEDKVALVAALGNAALAESFDAVLALLADPAEEVRAQVATSLRHDDTASGRAALLRLVTDGHARVAIRALASLQGLSLTGDEVTRLAALVAEGRTSSVLDPALIAVALEHRADARAAGARMMRVVAARAQQPELAARAHEALELLDSPGR